MPTDAGTIFKDWGFAGLGLATTFYLARAVYGLTRANGSRPATLSDVVKAIEAHAKEEKEHHDKQEDRELRFIEALGEMRADIMLLLDRWKRAP